MGNRTDKIKNLIKQEKDSANVIEEMLELFESMENEVTTLSKRCEDLENEVDAINEDISALNDGMHIEEYDDSVFSAVCPYCHEEIEINIENLEENEEFKCPNCSKEITLDWDEDCDCGCGHDHGECDCDDCDCDCDEDDDEE